MAPSSPEIENRVRELAERIAASEGIELIELEFRSRGSRWLIRVFIDRQGGVSAEECATVSRQLGAVLDVEDLIPHRYTLEVSSPGMDRPLRGPRDFQRNLGRLVKVITRESFQGQGVFQGRIRGCGTATILLEGEEGAVEIPLEEIVEAKLQVEWRKRPGGKGDRTA